MAKNALPDAGEHFHDAPGKMVSTVKHAASDESVDALDGKAQGSAARRGPKPLMGLTPAAPPELNFSFSLPIVVLWFPAVW